MSKIAKKALSQTEPEPAKQPVRKNSEETPQQGKLRKIGGAIVVRAKGATQRAWKATLSLSSDNLAKRYRSVAKALSTSRAIAAPTRKAILEHMSVTYKTGAKAKSIIVSDSAVFLNALLASNFGKSMESWLGATFNEGIPSVYDKAVDAVYNSTHIGGGHLHRLLDGSHTLWGMWDKVRDASPNDTFLQEVMGYASALGKDISSPTGIPLFGMSKSSYDQLAGFLSTTFHIPKHWFADMLHVNAVELVGASVSTIAVALNWTKKDVEQFGSLAGSIGIPAIASANPALAVVALVVLSKSFVDAKKKDDFSAMLNGLARGGVGTGAFLASASIVGGPIWVGTLVGLCVGTVVHTTMKRVDVREISAFVEGSLRKTIAEPS